MKVGILGGGQLARMLAEAGVPMGLEFVFFDPKPDACAAALGELVVGDWHDAEARSRLEDCDRITADFENVPAEVLDSLAERVTVRPAPSAFAAAQDRLEEKRMFERLDIPVGPFAPVSSRSELLEAIERIGLPAVLKTRRLGYDGKGQAVLRSQEDLEPAWQRLGDHDLILEGWVDYRHECAMTAVRSASGEVRCYPLSWTVHADGILRLALAPAPVAAELQERAEVLARRLIEALDYVGALSLELFATADGLLANEFAPRVHNSAHWTIEGAVTSQFENHLRAVCDWPLGDTSARGHSLMVNWIGEMPGPGQLLDIPGLAWHDYTKAPRPGRKIGHATLVAETADELSGRALKLADRLDPQAGSLLKGLMTPEG